LQARKARRKTNRNGKVSYSAVVCIALIDIFHWQMNPKSTIKKMQTGLEDMLTCTMRTKNKTWTIHKSGMTFTGEPSRDHKIGKREVENMVTILVIFLVTILSIFSVTILAIFSGNSGAWYVIFLLPK
jgi:hypothetical protein